MKFGAVLVFGVGVIVGEDAARETLSGRTLAVITASEAVSRRESFLSSLQMIVRRSLYRPWDGYE